MSEDATDEAPGPDRDLALQLAVTRIALSRVDGFALAGSGAIREHGVTDRPTEDVDLFTSTPDVAAFALAVEQVSTGLQADGYVVEQTRRAPQFARLHVVDADGRTVDVDLGVDWRHDDPVVLRVGPVLSLADAVGSKVGALYSRGEPRDYLDVDAIRASGLFDDAALVEAAASRDAGFDLALFAQQLADVRRISPRDVLRYGVSAEQLEQVKTRCAHWSAQLRQQPSADQTSAAAAELRQAAEVAEVVRPGYPTSAAEAVRSSDEQPGQSGRPGRFPAGPDRGRRR